MPTNRTRNKPKRGEAWKKAFLASIEKGATVTEAADAARVGRSTVYDARISDPEFAERWDKYQAHLLESIEKTLYMVALGGDTTALIYVTKAKLGWSDKPQQDAQHRAQLEAFTRAVYEIPPAAQKQLFAAYERELGIHKALEAG